MNSSEKRAYERTETCWPAQFHQKPENTKLAVTDISASGVRLKSSSRLFYNQEVAVDVLFPDGQEPILLKGRVAWARIRGDHMWDVGLKFPLPLFSKMASLYTAISHQAI